MSKKNINSVEENKIKPLAFVIMPFSSAKPLKKGYSPLKKDDLDTIYNMVSRALSRFGYNVRRAESPTDILRDIVLDLDKAELVVADITSLNPNVMYELGIRHGFCKKTILLSQDLNELPFDIAGYQCLKYSWVTDSAKRSFSRDLKDILNGIDNHPDPRFGPVHTHIGSKFLGLSDEENKQTSRKLMALTAELFFLFSQVQEVHKELAERYPEAIIKQDDGYLVKEELLPNPLPEDTWRAARLKWPAYLPSIDLYLSHRYVPDDYDQYEDITYFTHVLGTFRFTAHVADDSPSHFLGLRGILDRLTDDIQVIAKAVKNRMTGEDLKLRLKVESLSYQKSKENTAQQ